MVKGDRERSRPAVADALAWHVAIMDGLDVPNPDWVGRFRGEPGLTALSVVVGTARGAPAARVRSELAAFERTLRRVTTYLDETFAIGRELDIDGLAAVVNLAAWAHCEWVRIHPFANGNGRTARLWANAMLLRYGIPPVLRPRPRPGGAYAAASARAMKGDWQPMVAVLRKLVDDLA